MIKAKELGRSRVGTLPLVSTTVLVPSAKSNSVGLNIGEYAGSVAITWFPNVYNVECAILRARTKDRSLILKITSFGAQRKEKGPGLPPDIARTKLLGSLMVKRCIVHNY